jgi:hypothetical protein
MTEILMFWLTGESVGDKVGLRVGTSDGVMVGDRLWIMNRYNIFDEL